MDERRYRSHIRLLTASGDFLNNGRATKIFTTAVLTLNFDLDLSEVNNEQMMNTYAGFYENRTFRPYLSTNYERHERTNQPTNQQTRPITIRPNGGYEQVCYYL